MEKRILSLFLILCLALSLCAFGVQNAAAENSATSTEPTTAHELSQTTEQETSVELDEELRYAASIGLTPDMPLDAPASYRGLYRLLDRVVELCAPERLEEWLGRLTEARISDETMTRATAMVALFDMAEFLGGDFWNYNDTYAIRWENCPWETGEWDPDPMGYYGDLMRFPRGFAGLNEDNGSNFGGTAYFYSMGRVSLMTESPLFDYGVSPGSMRCAELLTNEEAARATCRFCTSDQDTVITERIPTDLDIEILSEIEERRQEILASPADVAVTGTSYYVSADGDDGNDGRSPEAPWKTLERVNKAPLQSGDGVFFKRGDLWRGEALSMKAGVTYSAYGEGAKPAFYGSPENGADPAKWTLLEGTDNIWVFYREVLECGSIVFDDREAGFKVTPHLQDGRYTMPDGSGVDFDVRQALLTDLSFYSEDDSFIRSDVDLNKIVKHTGRLFLRCDQGNPGSLFDSIELCTWMNVNSLDWGLCFVEDREVFDTITLDNIAVKYVGIYGVNAAWVSMTVQNCEIGWIGGCTWDYTDNGVPIQGGNCVGAWGTIENYSVIHCWLYQGYDSGISDEGGSFDWGADSHRGLHYLENLIENCVYGIEMFIENTDIDTYVCIEDVEIKDNLIVNTGFGFGSKRQDTRAWDVHAAIMMHNYLDDLINVRIRDNVFYRSRTYLMICGLGLDDHFPTMSGNTYVQDNFSGLCVWHEPNAMIEDGYRPLVEYYFNANAKDVVETVMGDTTAIVAELSY